MQPKITTAKQYPGNQCATTHTKEEQTACFPVQAQHYMYISEPPTKYGEMPVIGILQSNEWA
jgi:hypothetical protein